MKASFTPSHKRVTSIQSVSTDATLGEDGNCSETEFSDTSPRAKALMVLFDCCVKDAAPITVKNTFVEMDIPRPLEWEGCFDDREVQSAPGSVLISPAEGADIPPWVELDQDPSDSEGDSEQDGESDCGPDEELFAKNSASPFFVQPPRLAVMPGMQKAPVLARPAAVTLRLAEALEPVGFAAIPTIGSAGHALRKCKPCAFAWKESGCQSGASCKFCHLCDPAEKKRRRKAKLQLRRNRSMKKAEILL
jgi:hypothetical protein